MFNEVVPIVKLTIVKTQIYNNLRKDSIESALICANVNWICDNLRKSAFLRLSVDSRLRLLIQSHLLIEKI